jgi:hypothetical protein
MRSTWRTPVRTATLAAALAVWLLAMPCVSPAAATPAPQPAGDSVTGTAALDGNASVVFDAHSGAEGENPTGTLTVLLPGTPVTSRVTCLTVSGNRATIGFGFESGIGGLVFVEDNDGAGRDRFIGLGIVLEPAPTVCPAAPPPRSGAAPHRKRGPDGHGRPTRTCFQGPVHGRRMA